MGDNLYKIAGNVMIPEEKREEFNRYILRILRAESERQRR